MANGVIHTLNRKTQLKTNGQTIVFVSTNTQLKRHNAPPMVIIINLSSQTSGSNSCFRLTYESTQILFGAILFVVDNH